jgi:hypothetical protein
MLSFAYYLQELPKTLFIYILFYFMLLLQLPRGVRRWSMSVACWDCVFESRRGHGCLSVETVVCYQVEVSASG